MHLERQIGRLLADTGATVAVAESCTGGMLGSRITSPAGSSAYFMGGVIAYSNEAKIRELGVEGRLLRRVGAVSGEVARRMAEGVREKFGADFGVAITGVAGPGGGTVEKPVGLVYIAISSVARTLARELRLSGDRRRVRESSCRMALLMLREALRGSSADQ